MSVNSIGGNQALDSIPTDTTEGMLCATYLRYWEQKNHAATEAMNELQELNDTLKVLNELMTPLGTIQAKMGDDNSNASLIRALDSDPGLLYQINQKMKEAGLKLFPRTQDGKTGAAYEHFGLVGGPELSGVRDAKMPADLFPHVSQSGVMKVIRDNPARWTGSYKKVAENLLNRSLPDDPGAVTSEIWNAIARIVFTNEVPSSLPPQKPPIVITRLNTAGPDAPLRAVLTIHGQPTIILSNPPIYQHELESFITDVSDQRRRDFEWEMDLRVTGGLNKSFDGPAIYNALQTVKAEISDISSRLQAKTVDVNSALQRASAALNAVVELINRLFSTLGKVLG